MSAYSEKNTIDLHIHTNFSDGTDDLEKVLDLALCNGLQYISITDHESMSAYKNKELMNKYKLTIIPGTELHTYDSGYEIHLLGYGLDIFNSEVDGYLKKLRHERTEVAFETVSKINKAGISLDWSLIERQAGTDTAVTKAHIIAAMREKKVTDKNIYYSYFHYKGDNYLPYKGNPFETAFDFLVSHGAKPFLAHPGLINNDQLVEDLVKKYLVGLEVYYNYYGTKKDEWIKKYETMAINYDILYSGGSDYHGHITPSEIGGVYVPETVIEKLLL